MRKLALAARPLLPLALGVATSRYLPGGSRLPLRRPVKRNVLVPADPAWVKFPFSVTRRVHFFFLPFFFVARSQLVFLPCLTLRPLLGRWTLKRTLAAAFSVYVTFAP